MSLETIRIHGEIKGRASQILHVCRIYIGPKDCNGTKFYDNGYSGPANCRAADFYDKGSDHNDQGSLINDQNIRKRT